MHRDRALLFADFTCPFSHVTEALLRRVATGWEGEVEHRAFELFPAPAPLPPPGADEWPPELLRLAEEAGVGLGAPVARPRTRKAHEAARFAAEQGRGEAMRAAIYAAFWEEGRDIGRIDVLTSVGAGVGLDADMLRIALDIDAHSDAVEAERREAQRLGIEHTPTLIVGEGAALRSAVGALPAAELEALLRGGPAG